MEPTSILKLACILCFVCSGCIQGKTLEQVMKTEEVNTNEQYVKDTQLLNNSSVQQWYNPVFQNHSALLDWIAKPKPGDEVFQFDYRVHTSGVRLRRSLQEVGCDGLCSRSLCPWNEEWDEDSNRVPRFVKYAMCTNHNCDYNIQGVGQGVKNRLRRYTYCDKVRTDILVFENDQEKWLTNWPIACICSRHRTETSDVYLTAMAASFSSARGMPGNPALQRQPQARVPMISNANTGVDFDVNESSDSGVRTSQNSRHGTRHMTGSQRRRLRAQRRRMRTHSETFEELMTRRRLERENGSNSN